MTLSLERRADLWGDRTAVVDATADRRVSYAELESEADAMARRLAALDVGPGDPVAVISRNRVETLALFFAVRRLGGVLAPVSHRLTPATVEEPLEIIDPDVVVHEAAQRDLVREIESDRTHTFEDLGRHEGEDYERTDRDPEDSLLYLHATTHADRPAVGEDEGGNRPGESLNEDPQTASRVVDLPERAVEWNCITAVAAWGLGRGDCAPALLPFSDTEGLHRLTLPLLYVGGRVAILRAFDPESALAVVTEEGATALFAGATEYRELVEAEAFETTDFGSVEWVGTRSALPEDVREALARKAPVVRAYGRVETGPNNLLVPPDESGSEGDDSDRVGRPFPDCEVRIVDEGGSPISGAANGESGADGESSANGGTGAVGESGAVGELEVRGPVTARGYLTSDGGDGTNDGGDRTNDGGDRTDDGGDRTTEEFPEWIRTGDLAFRGDGDYYLLGPTGETLDAPSARVHPREVERALEAREGVTAAGVVPDAEGVLTAFVGEAEPGELREALEDQLPDDATVRELDRVESLPRRATGEVDRAELRRQLGGEERIDKG